MPLPIRFSAHLDVGLHCAARDWDLVGDQEPAPHVGVSSTVPQRSMCNVPGYLHLFCDRAMERDVEVKRVCSWSVKQLKKRNQQSAATNHQSTNNPTHEPMSLGISFDARDVKTFEQSCIGAAVPPERTYWGESFPMFVFTSTSLSIFIFVFFKKNTISVSYLFSNISSHQTSSLLLPWMPALDDAGRHALLPQDMIIPKSSPVHALHDGRLQSSWSRGFRPPLRYATVPSPRLPKPRCKLKTQPNPSMVLKVNMPKAGRQA